MDLVWTAHARGTNEFQSGPPFRGPRRSSHGLAADVGSTRTDVPATPLEFMGGFRKSQRSGRNSIRCLTAAELSTDLPGGQR